MTKENLSRFQVNTMMRSLEKMKAKIKFVKVSGTYSFDRLLSDFLDKFSKQSYFQEGMSSTRQTIPELCAVCRLRSCNEENPCSQDKVTIRLPPDGRKDILFLG